MVKSNQGKQEKVYFNSKSADNKTSIQKKLIKNMQLNNFVNSTINGWLEMQTKNFFGLMKSWESKFCVLSNIGLLYWTDILKAPNDLFPVLDCVIRRID